MKIGILVCGYLNPDLSARYGRMSAKALKTVNENIQCEHFEVIRGELPDLDECDGYLVTGSTHSAYENEAWILSLIDWVKRCETRRKPLVGIGFGHQLITRALGGTVERSAKGWGLGSDEVQVVAQKRWMNLSVDTLRMLVSHQDQVVTIPRGMRVIATNDFCPNFMLAKDNHILTIQGHPESSAEFLLELVEMRKHLISESHYEDAKKQILKVQDSTLVLHWIDAFFLFNIQASNELGLQQVG